MPERVPAESTSARRDIFQPQLHIVPDTVCLCSLSEVSTTPAVNTCGNYEWLIPVRFSTGDREIAYMGDIRHVPIRQPDQVQEFPADSLSCTPRTDPSTGPGR